MKTGELKKSKEKRDYTNTFTNLLRVKGKV